MKVQGRRILVLGVAVSLLLSSLPLTSFGAESKKEIYGANQLVHQARFADCELEYGIDVSHHQGKIDWKKVKEAGISFAIIRVAARGTGKAGGRITDSYYKRNMQEAAKYEIPFGVYVYSQALDEKEAREEADWVLEAIRGCELQLPVVFDYEYADGGRLTSALSKTKKTNNCLAFCKKIEDAGYQPMLYANKSFLENSINASAISQYYPIWLAHYTKKTTYAGIYSYWQYTAEGKVDGISGKVDMNVRYRMPEQRVEGLQITKADSSGITLSWEPLAGALEYEVYRRTGDEDFQLVDTVEKGQTTYQDSKVSDNIPYHYRVRVVLGKSPLEYGSDSDTVTGYSRITEKVQGTAKGVAYNKVTISWQFQQAAQGYEIWRYESAKKKYEYWKNVALASTLSVTDTDLHANATYLYKVRLYRNVNGTKQYGLFSDAIRATTLGSRRGRVSSDRLNVRSNPTLSGKVLKIVKKDTLLTITGSDGDWYRITLPVNGKNVTAYVSQNYVKLISVGVPTLKATAKFDRVILTWNAISGAAGYDLQRYNGKTKTYETIETISKGDTVRYVDKERTANTTYRYRIRAYKLVNKKKVYSYVSGILSMKTKMAWKGTTTGKISLRSGAGAKYKVVKTVKKGTRLTIQSQKGQWYRVTVTVKGKKKTAYVHKKYIKV